jgi:hypothetical protein
MNSGVSNYCSKEEAVDIQTAVPFRLPDGTNLVADIYTPLGKGPYPVLLMRQPYGRDIASTVVYAQPTWFCRKGFIVVIQDVRGRGDSDGEFYAFRNEAEDGFQTVEWAASLPKSNGAVGMYGFSYQGSTQLLAASQKPPSLKAIAPHMTAFDLYSGWFYRDGLLQQASTLGWGNQMLREDALRHQRWDLYRELERTFAQPGCLSRILPISSVSPLTDAGASPYVRDWLEHEKPGTYWSEFDFLKRVAELSHIPCFHLSGWYDFYTRGSMDGYRAMAAVAPEKQKLIVGPWIHIPWGTNIAGKRLGAHAHIDVNTALADWMHYWCGSDTERDLGSPVSYFSMGDCTWHKCRTWPPESSIPCTFLLVSLGGANSIFGDGKLVEGDCPDSQGCIADRFIYDPEVPVLAPGAQPSGYTWGPVDLYPSQQGNNLLVYTSDPVEGLRSFAGQPVCRLSVRSSASHTAFVARLSINRDESSQFLCLGAAQLTPEQMGQDGVSDLQIYLDDIAFSMSPGDRLCLDISSSAFPLLARHPNTPDSPNKVSGPENFARATQVVLHDKVHPSILIIPEVLDDE